jgi:purine catabolism regulator
MASLRELIQTLLPTAEPLVDARTEAMARTVTWVRLLRTRLPAFDGMDAGDLALIPLNTLRAVAPDEAARREMVEYLADHNATGILAIASESSNKDEDTALQHLVAAAAVTRLPCLLVRSAEPAQLERSLIGAVVNRRAELERQAVALERQIAALALDGQGLDALIGALAAFIGRAVALEARGGASLAVVAPAGLPGSAAAAKAVSRYLGKHRAEGQRIPLPAVPGAPDTERHGDGQRAEEEESPLSDDVDERPGSIVLLGDEPVGERDRIACERVAPLLALEIVRVAAELPANAGRGETRTLPVEGPPWVAFAARQPRPHEADVPALRRELRLLAGPRRFMLRGSNESLEVRIIAVADASDPGAQEIAKKVSKRLNRPVAVSKPFADATARPAAEAEARDALESLERRVGGRSGSGGAQVVRADLLPAHRLLGAVTAIPDGRRQALALLEPLLNGTPAARKQRIATLRAVLDTPGAAEASSSLGVHRNTTAYRVKRIEELTGWDLREADLRLALSLALRILDAEGGPEATS